MSKFQRRNAGGRPIHSNSSPKRSQKTGKKNFGEGKMSTGRATFLLLKKREWLERERTDPWFHGLWGVHGKKRVSIDGGTRGAAAIIHVRKGGGGPTRKRLGKKKIGQTHGKEAASRIEKNTTRGGQKEGEKGKEFLAGRGGGEDGDFEENGKEIKKE